MSVTLTSPHTSTESEIQAVRPLGNQRVALVLLATIVFAMALYYFVGLDEGMSSVFGKTMVIHEWVHDSRHFLGFPCH